jgi:salicylate hydroxylase
MKRDPILIVGGGLGGLTTALALARRAYATRVLEGAAEFGAIGYGIQFGPNVFHVFDRLGLMADVLAVADSPPRFIDAGRAGRRRTGENSNRRVFSDAFQISLHHRSPHRPP